jgi:hypothetical protein
MSNIGFDLHSPLPMSVSTARTLASISAMSWRQVRQPRGSAQVFRKIIQLLECDPTKSTRQ